MRGSLRYRLLAILFASVLTAWLAAAFFSYLDTRREAATLLDRQLAETTELLLRLYREEAEPSRLHLIGPGGTLDYQLWGPDGRLLLHSADAPGRRLAEAAGFSDLMRAGTAWRVHALADPARGLWAEVAEPTAIRHSIAEAVAVHLMHTLVVALPLLALLIWLAVGWGLAPLRSLAEQVRRRAPDSLQPLDLQAAPQETRPLGEALNALFGRVTQTLEREQRFAGDAAHELRTPLAAIKTHLEVALAAETAAERLQATRGALRGSERAAHLVEQLLTLARLDGSRAPTDLARVDLTEIARISVQAAAPAALERDIDLGLVTACHGAWVTGSPLLLEILLRNLIDNAVRYSPPGRRVDLAVRRENDRVTLIVTDQGPGIPAAERERICEPFYRILGSGEEGSGLGLSIVARIAQMHGAALQLAAPGDGPGLAVSVRFAAASHAP